MNGDRFDELLECFVDGVLDEGSSLELSEAFAADAALKERFVEELRISNSLHGLAILKGDTIASEVMGSIGHDIEAPGLADAVLTELRPTAKRFPIIRAAVGLAAAIAVTVAILSGLRPDPLATVAQTVGAVWEEGASLEGGDELGPGKLRLREGIVRLDFAKGVRLTLQGPAEFELIKPDETRLHSGRLTAHVPPEGIGFQVHTEKAEITDLGTTFGVSVDSSGRTDVLVFEGEVEVAAAAGNGKGTVIREGKAVSVDGRSNRLKSTRFEPRSFDPGWPMLFGVINTGGHVRFINAQPVGNPAEVEDGENVIVFPERFGTSPKGSVPVTLTGPGEYHAIDLRGRKESLKLGGRKVNTYLLQYNPPRTNGNERENVPFAGEVTFDRPILAVITDPDMLRETDGRLGKRRFAYDARPVRGLEHGDSISLSPDRRTLGIDWLVRPGMKHGMDQVRVIVDAAVPVYGKN